MSFEDDMEGAYDACALQLDDRFLIVGFQMHGERFQVWACQGEALTPRMLEAAAGTLLGLLAADAAEAPDTVANLDRVRRAQKARQALAVPGEPLEVRH